MTDTLKLRLEMFKKNNLGFDPSFYVRFFNLLERHNIDENTIKKLMDYALNPECLEAIKLDYNSSCYMLTSRDENFRKGKCEEFFNWFKNRKRSMGQEWFASELKLICNNIDLSYNSHHTLEGNYKLPFPNVVISSQIIQKPEALQIETKQLEEDGKKGIKINFEYNHNYVSGLTAYEINSTPPCLMLSGLILQSGFQHTGIEKAMLDALCVQMNRVYPGYGIIIDNFAAIKKRHIRQCSNLGAVPINCKFDRETQTAIFNETPLTKAQVEKCFDAPYYYFDANTVKNFAENPEAKLGDKKFWGKGDGKK